MKRVDQTVQTAIVLAAARPEEAIVLAAARPEEAIVLAAARPRRMDDVRKRNKCSQQTAAADQMFAAHARTFFKLREVVT
jgi:hypothetical protein